MAVKLLSLCEQGRTKHSFVTVGSIPTDHKLNIDMKYTEFNWAELNRDFLFGIFYDLETNLVGVDLTGRRMFAIISKQIHRYLPLRTRKIVNKSLGKNHLAIGGHYCFDRDEHREKSITIDFYFRSFDQPIKLKRSSFLECGIIFADTVLHEIIHMRQHRRRNFNSRPYYKSRENTIDKKRQQGYLGCLDEIDAYAFNISCELMDYFNLDEDKSIRYLNKPKKTISKENSYQMYLKAFDYDHDHAIIKKLKKKIVAYFPKAKQGRPFTNSDWIYY